MTYVDGPLYTTQAPNATNHCLYTIDTDFTFRCQVYGVDAGDGGF